MQEIPNWIIKMIEKEKLICSQCKRRFRSENLMSMGVQVSSQSPHADTLCIGMYCHKCKELTIFELKEMTLIEFAFEILNREKHNNVRANRNFFSDTPENYHKRNRQKSRITLKEIKENVKFLNKIKTHEEFLVAMGMSLSEIDKYNFKKKKPKK